MCKGRRRTAHPASIWRLFQPLEKFRGVKQVTIRDAEDSDLSFGTVGVKKRPWLKSEPELRV